MCAIYKCSTACALVVSHPLAPDEEPKRDYRRRNDGHKIKLPHEFFSSQISHRRIEGRKCKRYDPTQQKLDKDVVNRHGVAAECDHVIDRRRESDTIFKPEVHAA